MITHGFSRMRPVRSLQIPHEVVKVPQISQIYTDLLWEVFVTQISQMTQIFLFFWDFFIHRMTRNLFGDFLLGRLLTDFRGCDLFGRCRYPLRSDKSDSQRFYKKICENLWNLWDKNSHEEKSAPSAKSAWQNNSSIFRAPAIGQRPNIRENPWVIR